ncbi:hypothetical protein BDZ91DRAFT_551024 [Kalaharituber pfeilii]|nr:hypothetical protein BDZ91DRAFT_551024 [Kalaharituber pfeilii]
MLIPRLLCTLFLATHLLPAVLGADCWGQKLEGSYRSIPEDQLWRMRERVCGEVECPNRRSNCRLAQGVNESGMYVGGGRSGGKDTLLSENGLAFPSCWGAVEQIITQCYRNDSKAGGSWSWGEEQFVLGIYDHKQLPNQQILTFTGPLPEVTPIGGDNKPTSTTPTDGNATHTTSAPSRTGESDSESDPKQTKGALSISVGAAIMVACISFAVFSLLALVFFLVYRRRKQRRMLQLQSNYNKCHAESITDRNTNSPSQVPSQFCQNDHLSGSKALNELETEAQKRDVARHLNGVPPLQAPLVMVRGQVVYTPGELQGEGVRELQSSNAQHMANHQ